MENLVADDEKGKAGGREGIFSQKRAWKPCPCSSHRARCWSPSSGAVATLWPPHPRGFTGSDAAAGCCRCLGKSNPSQNATPARWGLSASRVLVSLAPRAAHRSPKCGKKINPTISSKPPSFAPQEASQRNVSFSGKHHLIGKTPAKGEKVFTSRSLCDGVARMQLTFPFAQPCGCCGVDTI